ncbi:MAG: phosphotransferase family protein [Alphaproteobacteria bacterium]|nr:phosphotransferase family protein [Alphaproteobacteria bacterium]
MGLIDGDARQRLRDFLTDVAGAPVLITAFEKLSGGAIQENWLLDISVNGGEWAGGRKLVLRRDARSRVSTSHDRVQEFALLKQAHKAGVTVPLPCLLATDEDILGGPFFIMHRVEGTAAGHKLVKRPEDDNLAAELGKQLARIHTIKADETLSFLDVPEGSPAFAAVAIYRRYLDELLNELGQSRPALEWGLRWLELNAPETGDIVLCHRDYRTGNYMVDDAGQLTGILDWEFSGWGEQEEDIGWFCAKCWRFGADDRAAGGIAGRDAFYRAYEDESGRTIDRSRVDYWETMAHVRWAVIACQQAARHVSGEQVSLELALTQHLVPELEMEILARTGATMIGEAADA